MNKLIIQTWVTLIILTTFAFSESKPNIILINADDLGIGLLETYGQKIIKTPNINRLVEEGMRLENHYGAVFCAPSRWTLLTGMHCGRIGGYKHNKAGLLIDLDTKKTPCESVIEALNNHVQKTSVPIPDNEIFLAQIAQQAGYKTAQFGKLDVGFLTNHERVTRFGWDHYVGYYSHSRAHGFYPPYLWKNGEKLMLEGNHRADCGKKLDKEPVGAGGETYSQNVFLEEMLNFIRKNKDSPFFIYHPTQLPHGPVAIPELHESVKDHSELSLVEKKYASMVIMLDDHVGVLMKELKSLGIDENTIIFFTSDNGHELYYGPKSTTFKKNKNGKVNLTDNKWRTSKAGDVFDGAGGRAGMKRATYQGGVQCPMIVRWPGKIKAGSETTVLSSHYDFMATLADLVSVEVPVGKDSISYLPTLLGNEQEKFHDYVIVNNHFTKMARACLITKDRLKLIQVDAKNSDFQLYSLKNDNEEHHNIATEHPEKVKKLKDILLSELESKRPDLK